MFIQYRNPVTSCFHFDIILRAHGLWPSYVIEPRVENRDACVHARGVQRTSAIFRHYAYNKELHVCIRLDHRRSFVRMTRRSSLISYRR